jgi:hypothetical protein
MPHQAPSSPGFAVNLAQKFRSHPCHYQSSVTARLPPAHDPRAMIGVPHRAPTTFFEVWNG